MLPDLMSRTLNLNCMKLCIDTGSRVGSGAAPDSPRQLNAEETIPWQSSVTTLSQSGSSLAHALGSDLGLTNAERLSLSASARSPFATSAKQTIAERSSLSASARSPFETIQQTIPEHSSLSASAGSPLTATAKQTIPKKHAKSFLSPFEVAHTSGLHQLAPDPKATPTIHSPFAEVSMADQGA